MKNFAFNHEGQELWYSRSLAVSLCTFALELDENGRLQAYVLANKRGDGCEFNAGKWNLPGGFIDFDETCEMCAARETIEETGVVVPLKNIYFNQIDSKPCTKRQTICASYFAYVNDKNETEKQFSLENTEPNEVAEVKFINLLELQNYKWTRGQLLFIANSFRKFFDNYIFENISDKFQRAAIITIYNKMIDNIFESKK